MQCQCRKATLPKFHVGDKVRIARKEGTFEKGFTPNWTKEVFTLTAVKATYYRGYAGIAGSGNLLRGRASVECAGNLPYRASAQEWKRLVECLSSGKITSVRSWIPLADLEQL